MALAQEIYIKMRTLLTQYWLLIVWLVMNLSIYYVTYKMFKVVPKHYYLRNIIGIGLCISRGTAPVLNLSCCLVLLPMCRSINTLINKTFSHISSELLTGWLARAKAVHKTLAYTIIVASVIHTSAHVVNTINFSKYYNELYPDINWASYKNQNPAVLVFTSLPGVTGIAMLLVLFLLAFTSLRWFRNLHYNVFWTTHNLSMLFYFFLYLHPLSGVMKEQTNIDEHFPGCVMNSTTFKINQTLVCYSEPKFECFKSTGWIWIIVPVSIYLIELLFRIYSRNRKAPRVQQAVRLPGKVIHLSLFFENSNLTVSPGQFILIQCEYLSKIEWHPFTVTSFTRLSSGRCIINVLIKARGDWTNGLYNLLSEPIVYKPQMAQISRLHSRVQFHVDGPYSSPMTKVIHSEYAICVAAGVGITAFVASFLYLLETKSPVPKRLHLIWIVRNPAHLLWYAKLICNLHHKFWMQNDVDRFNIDLYVTKSTPSNAQTNLGGEYIFLKHRLNFQRPNFHSLFTFWGDLYRQQRVHVFTCGPKSLAVQIKKHCYEANFIRKYDFHFLRDSYS